MAGDILKIAGIALIGIIAALTVKGLRPETAVCISLTAGIMILVSSLAAAESFFQEAQQFINSYGLADEGFKAALKITGIAYIAQFAADTCRDCGESAVASKVELAGRLMIITAAFPLVVSTVEAIGGLIGQ